MTYATALQVCTVNRLQDEEQRAYEDILHFLSDTTAVPPMNLFPLVMHLVSDVIASQLAHEPPYAREGCLVATFDEILTILRTLTTAKCIVAGTLERSGA